MCAMKYAIRQEKFISEFIVSNNGTQAAIAAGYSPRSARQQASRLLTKANISIAIKKKRSQAARISGLRVADVVQGLLSAIEAGKRRGDANAQIAGWREIAKLLGFYPETTRKGKPEIDPANIQTLPSEMLVNIDKLP